jgi:hypothetical protein
MFSLIEKEKNVKKQAICFFIILIVSGGVVFPQSNSFIDSVLEKKEAACGEAFFMALSSAGLVNAEGSVDEAMKYIETNKWGLPGDPEAPVTLGELCYALMRAHQLKGGLMYELFPGPRYAAREFEYLGWVRRSPVPSRRVSGEEVLQIIGQVLEFKAPSAGMEDVQ